MKHPIEIPPELFAEWLAAGRKQYSEPALIAGFVAGKAAEWAADQQLDKCCEWLSNEWRAPSTSDSLRIAMRPKPPSLKEQALAALERELDLLHRAIESILDADESRLSPTITCFTVLLLLLAA